MTEYTKHRAARKREFFSYDGTIFAGRLVVDETGEAKGFNATGRLLGTFPGYDAARKAVSKAYCETVDRKVARAKAKAEALDRLNQPVGFVTGLPAHFLRRRA